MSDTTTAAKKRGRKKKNVPTSPSSNGSTLNAELKDLNEMVKKKEVTEKRLEKIVGPRLPKKSQDSTDTEARPESHWDHLLKEMRWLATDVAKERMRHVASGKKISKMMDAYEQSKFKRKVKQEKDIVIQNKRLASKIAKDVSKFWVKINKVIAFKQKSEADEARQKAMDKHLVFLVKQTERYTSLLADNLESGGSVGLNINRSPRFPLSPRSPAASRAKKRPLEDVSNSGDQEINAITDSPLRKRRSINVVSYDQLISCSDEENDESDGDYICEDELDDETTIIEAEKESDLKSTVNEIAMLKVEGEMSIEELRTIYLNNDNDEDVGSKASGSVQLVSYGTGGNERVFDEEYEEEDDNDDEFIGEDELDDETTLIEAEAEENQMSTQQEIIKLRAEGEMSIEQLRAMYADMDDRSDVGSGTTDDDEEAELHKCIEIKSRRGRHISAIIGTDSSNITMDDGFEQDESDDDEFIGEDEIDDESTLIEAEAEGNKKSTEEEIAMLKAEGEMSIEQLKAMYANFDTMSDSEDCISEIDREASSHKIMESKSSYGRTIAAVVADNVELENEVETEQDDDDDFIGVDEVDDETTLIEAEAEVNKKSTDEEIAMLKAEGEISIEQLRAMYSNVYNASDLESDDDVEIESCKRPIAYHSSNDIGCLEGNEGGDERDYDDDEDFIGEDELDDETTLIEAEAEENRISTQEEIAKLKSDGEMSIEKLRAMYANMDDLSDSECDIDFIEKEPKISDMSCTDEQVSEEDDVGGAMKRLEKADLEARSIHVDFPFILSTKLSLREYQHVGLNWLVSLHERRLNGILADEMGLGKTIQTIALLAYLAVYRGIWGPHLIVVPTSCLINWELEFKRWCPAFKVLTYYGSAKARKALRTGWSKQNAFQVCITSYQLVVQDASAFRRKQWYYLVLDEAHNIKNFKSQRWQTLLNFNTQRRLLLTGTPLQNNLMELWSLMHFLMPYIFRSRKEFSYWFNNPLTGMVEGNRGISNDILSRLHGIMRPFLLRRLKKDVAKQLPPKYEHVVMCKLSKRQAFLYEEFMSRSTTRNLMSGGNYLGMMNILMQLRKVCNHPDLFEPRPIVSPFKGEDLICKVSTLVNSAYSPHCTAILHLNHPNTRLGAKPTSFWAYDLSSISRNEIEFLAIIDDHNLEDGVTSQHANEEDERQLADLSMLVAQTPRYRGFIADSLRRRCDERKLRRQSCLELSSIRCDMQCFINFSWHTTQACTTEPRFLDNVREVKLAKGRYYQRMSPIERAKSNRKKRDISAAWEQLVYTAAERAEAMLEIIKEFVFVLPSVVSIGPRRVLSKLSAAAYVELKESEQISEHWRDRIEEYCAPFYPSYIRQKIFFPDRKLVQFDSGKLQVLASLLNRLKRGGHKCLIFTQMSKMLDILEIFLNLHAHTYVRLDGSTGVEKRQRLMDRFNTDPKIFAFILSTRSGGLGINLTGADSVIFYDSDWNPAMDAQAQDRAHRIGQTREVHIYRMVSTSTVEENILTKARQKRHLDFLVMSEGDFDVESIFTSSNISDLINSDKYAPKIDKESSHSNQESTKVNMEQAMAMFEDEEDVKATKGAQAEAALEREEFDESKVVQEDMTLDDCVTGAPHDLKKEGKGNKKSGKGSSQMSDSEIGMNIRDEEKADEEFATWQASVGGSDFKKLEKALKPIERFALRFHTDNDPFYSVHYLSEQQRLLEMEEDAKGQEWDIDAIEQQKEDEEYKALSQGEIIAVNLTRREISQVKVEYLARKAKIKKDRRLRELTGEGWIHCVDESTGAPFWYNQDTGEACYGVPSVIRNNEMMRKALQRRYNACPHSLLLKIFEYLLPYPERTSCSAVCAAWCSAARDPHFFKHVLSVETGAREREKELAKANNNKTITRSDVKNQEVGGKTNVFVSLVDALATCLPGDTVSLGVGHHVEQSIKFICPVRILGADDEPVKVVLELSGGLVVTSRARRVSFTGVTIERSRLSTSLTSLVSVQRAKLEMASCILDNSNSRGSSLWAAKLSSVFIIGCTVKGGARAGIALSASELCAFYSNISHNNGKGVSLFQSCAYLEDCYLTGNLRGAISLAYCSSLSLNHCDVRRNGSPIFFLGRSNISLSQWEYEEGDCFLYCRNCTGDEKTVSNWLSSDRSILDKSPTSQDTCIEDNDISVSDESTLRPCQVVSAVIVDC